MISIHALREESDYLINNIATDLDEISIHALREESDLWKLLTGLNLVISIHALREESDVIFCGIILVFSDFNPRSPRGERPGQ